MRRPARVKLYDRLPPPTTLDQRLRYSSWEQRGYLHPQIRERLLLVDPHFGQRYHWAKPLEPIEKSSFKLRNIMRELCQEEVLPS